jgi:hypothetical protein
MELIGRTTPRATPSRPAQMISTTRADTLQTAIESTPTVEVASASVAALASVVFLTISSMMARCAL